MARSTNPFRYFDSSREVIRLVVMIYVKYPLSVRNVEDLFFERGIDICHETVRLWWNRFGPMFAAEIRKKRVDRMRAHTHWRWHLDEVYVKVNGEMRYLWRAVDHEGEVLEFFVTTTREKAAALAFIERAIKRHGRPRAVVTDGLRSSGAAMRRFRRMKTLQKVAAGHGTVHNHFAQERHLIGRDLYRERRSAVLAEWRDVMG